MNRTDKWDESQVGPYTGIGIQTFGFFDFGLVFHPFFFVEKMGWLLLWMPNERGGGEREVGLHC